MSFKHVIPVLPEELSYLVPALEKELPPPFNELDNEDGFGGETLITIETDDPLTLEQRRFLTGCSFDFRSEYK